MSVPTQRRRYLVLGVALIVQGGACAPQKGQKNVPVAPSAPLLPQEVRTFDPKLATGPSGQGQVAGVWDWVNRSNNEQGDLRVEQEEWHLQEERGKITGYYDRQVVTLSSDQRPFRCNGALAFTKTTRVRVAGQVRGEQVNLQEVAADSTPHPCDTGERNLTSYLGQIQGDSLLLRFPPSGTQFLTRRAPGVAMPALSNRPASAAPGAAGAAPLGGDWEWELRSVNPEGDLQVEREEWHLEEKNAELRGYYRRTVQKNRPSGAFACNGSSQMLTTTQYAVRGQRFGDRLSISEVDYKTAPNPCDNTLRRLDTYQGSISPTGQEIILTWGAGSQMLRRSRGR